MKANKKNTSVMKTASFWGGIAVCLLVWLIMGLMTDRSHGHDEHAEAHGATEHVESHDGGHH